ncbi:hypothetical protein N8H22_16260 [Stutzerimonas stutzeri]|uniref:hypothetical protein n=1 Tax=Stutzerimonas sp. S1 TaxID=3030652 RepID=UPI00222582E5|nr:hypothetical protein [Stutzerimonas sp. S1]MCW3150158.1 hypothetical protein [Stutzerimonas sp. S1]
MRSELSTFRAPSVQRAYAIKRRKEIWEIRNPSLGGTTCSTQKATEHKDRPQNQKQFAADTAEATGQSKQDINRHVSRAEALGDDLLEVTGTSPIPSALRLARLSSRSCKAA